MSISKYYCGIDPGKSGGVAFVSPDGQSYQAFKMPDTRVGLVSLLREWSPSVLMACCEHVHSGAWGASGAKMGAASAFTFGRMYEGPIVALVALGVKVDEVRPQVWQSKLGISAKGDKRKLKEISSQMFPGVKVTNYNADALLIAEYARRLNLGTLQGIEGSAEVGSG